MGSFTGAMILETDIHTHTATRQTYNNPSFLRRGLKMLNIKATRKRNKICNTRLVPKLLLKKQKTV